MMLIRMIDGSVQTFVDNYLKLWELEIFFAFRFLVQLVWVKTFLIYMCGKQRLVYGVLNVKRTGIGSTVMTVRIA